MTPHSPQLTLVIGSRNYSSWSLRPWLLARHLGLAFTEQLIPLDQPDSAARLAAASPTARVPVLLVDGQAVWESIAICETLCELAGRGLPAAQAVRAHARSVCAEMHAGFGELRRQWPMNARATGRRVAPTAALEADLARIEALWEQCLGHGLPGPWLYGEYSMADAMYAPVVLRMRTYGAACGPAARRYMDTVLADGHLRSWIDQATAEPWGADTENIGLA
jgi:glutathione S-transferase